MLRLVGDKCYAVIRDNNPTGYYIEKEKSRWAIYRGLINLHLVKSGFKTRKEAESYINGMYILYKGAM